MTIFSKLFTFLKSKNFWENLFIKSKWYGLAYIEIFYLVKMMLLLLKEENFIKCKSRLLLQGDIIKIVFFNAQNICFYFPEVRELFTFGFFFLTLVSWFCWSEGLGRIPSYTGGRRAFCICKCFELPSSLFYVYNKLYLGSITGKSLKLLKE